MIARLLAMMFWPALVLVPACSDSSSPPLTPPSAATPRIIALSPAAAVTLRDLGLESNIIARHAFDLALSPDLPVAGDLAGIDLEQLIKLDPTDIVIQWGNRELPPAFSELAQRRGWRVIRFDPLTLDQIRDSTAQLAEAFPQVRDRAREQLARMDALWSSQSGHASRASTIGPILLLIDVSPPAALGPGSFHQQILERRGGESAIRDGAPWRQLDHEDLIKLDPAAIILILPRPAHARADIPRAPDSARARAALGPLAHLGLRAVQNDRVALIDDPLAHTPSTAMIGFTEELSGILERWAH